ncbi:hypothetical protein B484DRAFT_464474 [Ochromonadaceae sp. CCMP2298]|nr:hypothetical protein B484DRAFT_464474 [Ochromonadaceae sp. CCMP2298]
MMTWVHGDIHEGQWLDGVMHRQELYKWVDGRSYQGQWQEDTRAGEAFSSGVMGIYMKESSRMTESTV